MSGLEVTAYLVALWALWMVPRLPIPGLLVFLAALVEVLLPHGQRFFLEHVRESVARPLEVWLWAIANSLPLALLLLALWWPKIEKPNQRD